MKKKLYTVVFLQFFAFLYAYDEFEYEDKCKSGNTHACLEIDNMCTEGNSNACHILYGLYQDGIGIKKDPIKATEVMTRICYKGNLENCVETGFFYEDGKTLVERDYKIALNLYSHACNGEYAEGCESLGRLYLNGMGVKKDVFKALSLYEKACDLGYSEACYNIGQMYEYGVTNIKKDLLRSKQAYEKACNLNDQGGCEKVNLLKHIKQKGEKKFTPTKLPDAIKRFQDDCNQGDEYSCEQYGRYLKVQEHKKNCNQYGDQYSCEQYHLLNSVSTNQEHIATDTELEQYKVFTEQADSLIKITDKEYTHFKQLSPAYAAADNELNKAFTDLRKVLTSAQKQSLKEEQNAWIKVRDKILYNTAKKYSQDYIDKLVELTQNRTIELNNRIH